MVRSSSEVLAWSMPKMVAFRFAFIFFILFIIFLDWSVNPFLPWFYYEGGHAEFLDATIAWVGKNIFNVSYTIISPYDAQHDDRTYIYLLYFTMGAVALLGTIIWTVSDRGRENYEVLYYWLTVIVRYYLAFTLFLFALEKFFKMQFPDLGYYVLSEPVGNLSPMSLAWAFFGYSYSYNVFIGIAESAALLLLFRRTTTLGALVTLATLANVMVVNYSYDVHAKMYPTALFIMTLFLLLPQLGRLFWFFLTSQPTSLQVMDVPLFEKRWMNVSKLVVKVCLIGYVIIFSVKDYVGYMQRRDSGERSKAQSGLPGVYDVNTFVVDTDTLSNEDQLRWREIIIGGALERVRLKGDSVVYADVSLSTREILVYGDRLELATNEQEVYNDLGLTESTYMNMDSVLVARQIKSRFHFALTDGATLQLKGKVNGDSVFITAKRRPMKVEDFRLMKARFHWITE